MYYIPTPRKKKGVIADIFSFRFSSRDVSGDCVFRLLSDRSASDVKKRTLLTAKLIEKILYSTAAETTTIYCYFILCSAE